MIVLADPPNSGCGISKGALMINIQESAGQVVASDTQNSIAAVDQAVASLAQLCASIIEVSKASNLPINTAQAALANAGNGLNNLIASRADLSDATYAMAKVQQASNLETVSFGCPPIPDRPSAVARAREEYTN